MSGGDRRASLRTSCVLVPFAHLTATLRVGLAGRSCHFFAEDYFGRVKESTIFPLPRFFLREKGAKLSRSLGTNPGENPATTSPGLCRCRIQPAFQIRFDMSQHGLQIRVEIPFLNIVFLALKYFSQPRRSMGHRIDNNGHRRIRCRRDP